jgi:phage baseplate assembly protein W
MATRSPIIDINRNTGELLQGWPRAKQAIEVIMTTRLKTRLMRLYFGSNLPNIQDKPGNQFVILDAFYEIAVPVNRWEPEFRVQRIYVDEAGPDGKYTFTVEGVYLPDQSNQKAQVTL